ncbi:coiled-coil domain-containing protein 86 [Triplophysa rosa]|uniref:Coiled-coil domain-containing protein 86 n=1 Tax=Triplophysa rosa TaxID=992332 RepID=A0A9W7WZU7_TRIRA|nr:coiled-coil domain-containing protein 86 [Triplophysa rosa]KAI7811081.1 coiled-coil domain-containing protein 86 [Triplophysa rosa]
MSASANKEIRGDSETELDPPVVSRTRSGRRVRMPAALLDSGTPATKTPVRRTRKSVIREDPAESSESRLESASEKPSEEGTEQTKVEPSATVTDVTESTKVEENQVSRQPVLDNVHLKESDQTSEKENIVSKTDAVSTGSKKAKKRTHSESNENKVKMVPLGKPKSGRVWKDRNKQRFSALLRDKPVRSSWEKKMEAKRDKQLVKQYQQQLKDEQARVKEEKKRRRAENLKRRAENERKAEIVQVIKNTAKIKRMKKKQLRKIEKRDTLSVLQKTPPSVKKSAGKKNSS